MKLWVVLSFLGVVSAKKQLWNLDETSVTGHRNRMLSEGITFSSPHFRHLEDPQLFSLNVADFQSIEEGETISFHVPSSSSPLKRNTLTKECSLREGTITLPKSATANIPNLKSYSCFPSEYEELNLFVTDEVMTGIFKDNMNRDWYIDKASADDHSLFVIYEENALVQAVTQAGDSPLKEEEKRKFELKDVDVLSEEVYKRHSQSVNRLAGKTNGQAYVYRFVAMASPLFSAAATKGLALTKANVAAAMADAMSRVNGATSREFGGFFQFINGFEAAICLSTADSATCAAMAEDNNGDLNAHADQFAAFGIPLDSYDLGHRFSNVGGGVAYIGVICNRNFFQAGGSSGGFSLTNPDSFALRTLIHEMGHMMSAHHSWKQCSDYQNQFSTSDSTEPGAGTTIMSYAGVCGSDNLKQTSTDPYYNSFSLVKIRNFLETRHNTLSCGSVIDITRTLPTLSTPENATIPVGNFFQLTGGTTQTGGSFFSWDRIDTGVESFQDGSLGRMRSYPATTSQSRFFPNLHFLNFDVDVTGEKLPEKERTWNVRFMQRSKFSKDKVGSPSAGVMGDFAYSDTRLDFKNIGKFTIDSPLSGANLSLSEPINFIINPGGMPQVNPGAKVQVLFAENTMTAVALNRFNYAEDVEALNWKVVAEVTVLDERFCTSVTLDRSDISGALDSGDANFMVRIGATGDGNIGDPGVYVFDLITGVTFFEGVATEETRRMLQETVVCKLDEDRVLFWAFMIVSATVGLGLIGYMKLKPKSAETSQPKSKSAPMFSVSAKNILEEEQKPTKSVPFMSSPPMNPMTSPQPRAPFMNVPQNAPVKINAPPSPFKFAPSPPVTKAPNPPAFMTSNSFAPRQESWNKPTPTPPPMFSPSLPTNNSVSFTKKAPKPPSAPAPTPPFSPTTLASNNNSAGNRLASNPFMQRNISNNFKKGPQF